MDKYLSGSASPDEEKLLFDWYELVQQENPVEQSIPAEQKLELLDQIRRRAKNPSSGRIYLWLSGAAAAIFLVLYTAGIFQPSSKDSVSLVKTVTTGSKKHRVILPDGTVLWLNANSTIKYPVVFDRHKRELWLSGEGYFEVKHNAAKPFTVHTPDLDVKVLGTVFNLKSYPHTQTETTLLKGSVQVNMTTGKKEQVILKPYQKLIAGNTDNPETGKKIRVEKLIRDDQDFVAETAWTQQAISFGNERLETIIHKLEKVYPVKIIIQDAGLKDKRFTGTFNNASINTVLNALQFSNEFEYRKEGETTIIIY